MKSGKDKHTLVWLNAVARGNRRYIAVLLVLESVLGFSGIGYAVFLRGLIDGAATGDESGLGRYALLLAALVLAQTALRSLYRCLDEFTRATLENGLKVRLFSTLLTRDYAEVTATHSGEWLNRLSSDSVVVADGMAHMLPGLAGMAIRMAAALGALLVMVPGFGGIVLGAGAVLILLTAVLRRRLKQLHSQVQASDGDLRVFLSERLGSLVTVRAFGKEQTVIGQSMQRMEQYKSARMRKGNFSNLCNSALSIAVNGAYILGAIYCGFEILAGRMSYGTFTAVLQLIGQAQAPISNISGFLPKFYAMLASAERLMEAEGYEPDAGQPTVPDIHKFYQEDFRELQLRDASFTYTGKNGAPVLRHMDLQIRKGEHVAFTGPSGCGKSTALKLLMSLYPLDGGERSIMSTDEEYPLTASWRELFAYVPQGNQLMNGTIREVVTFGDSAAMAQEARIWRALEIACAGQFVRDLQDGLDTVLGERGAGLSEGQMQRLAIARALFADRPVLLLDEATSALDEHTEQCLMENLRAMTDKTVVIVTHRRAVVALADTEVRFAREDEGYE